MRIKGSPKTIGSGRKKGSPNKKTLILKELLDDLGMDLPRKIRDCIKELDSVECNEPQERINKVMGKARIYLDLMPYIYPKRTSIPGDEGPKEQEVNVTYNLRWADEDGTANPIASTSNAPPEADQSVPEKI